MNILFYFESQINPQRGGTERATDLLAHYFREQGYSVYYMAKREVEGEYDIDTFFLPDVLGNNSQPNVDFVKEIIHKYKIDIIINQAGNGDDILLFSRASLPVDVKIITVLHFSIYQGLNYFSELIPLSFNPLYPQIFLVSILKWLKIPFNKKRAISNKRRQYRYLQKNSDQVVVLAEKYIQDMVALGGLETPRNIGAIPNPNTFERPACEYPALEIKEKEILFVGRLSFPEKRVDRLLKIWSYLFSEFPDWKLTIVGDGPDRMRLETMTKKMALDRVSFEGFQSPEFYYKRASIICMTSNHEGSPMVLREAMQEGVVPVVFNSFAGASDLIENRKTGILVIPFNKKLFAQEMREIMIDEQKRKQIAINAYECVKRYDIDHIAPLWFDLFRKIE